MTSEARRDTERYFCDWNNLKDTRGNTAPGELTVFLVAYALERDRAERKKKLEEAMQDAINSAPEEWKEGLAEAWEQGYLTGKQHRTPSDIEAGLVKLVREWNDVLISHNTTTNEYELRNPPNENHVIVSSSVLGEAVRDAVEEMEKSK